MGLLTLGELAGLGQDAASRCDGDSGTRCGEPRVPLTTGEQQWRNPPILIHDPCIGGGGQWLPKYRHACSELECIGASPPVLEIRRNPSPACSPSGPLPAPVAPVATARLCDGKPYPVPQGIDARLSMSPTKCCPGYGWFTAVVGTPCPSSGSDPSSTSSNAIDRLRLQQQQAELERTQAELERLRAQRLALQKPVQERPAQAQPQPAPRPRIPVIRDQPIMLTKDNLLWLAVGAAAVLLLRR